MNHPHIECTYISIINAQCVYTYMILYIYQDEILQLKQTRWSKKDVISYCNKIIIVVVEQTSVVINITAENVHCRCYNNFYFFPERSGL